MTGAPKNCVHCGRPADGDAVHVGYDEHGNRTVAHVPVCPKPATAAADEQNGQTR